MQYKERGFRIKQKPRSFLFGAVFLVAFLSCVLLFGYTIACYPYPGMASYPAVSIGLV